MSRVTGPVTVLRWVQGEVPRPQGLDALWRRAEAAGLLDLPAPQVGIRIARAWRSPLVVETAHSLARAVAEHLPQADVRVVDAEEDVGGAVLHVAGIAVPQLAVPMDWFEPRCLVTVTGVGPHALGRLHGVLAAQAEPLSRLDDGAMAAAVVYEAHRLAASDLVVACGEAPAGRAAGEAWWIVSASDVGADMALAGACGLEPAELAFLRAIASHEDLPVLQESGARLPDLAALAAPALPARMRTAQARLRAAGRALAKDVRAIHGNLGKIPNFVRRRLPGRRGTSA